MNRKSENSLSLNPIGFLHTDHNKKFQLPPQPDQANWNGVIELLPRSNFEIAVRDLEGFDRIWLVWWFHQNKNWKPTTLPPRGRTGRKGVFATRSPYRPNPIALSCVRLLAVDGLKLHIGAHDLLDQTPILDIKPYIPKFDSFPEASSGWFGEMEEAMESAPTYEVSLNEESVQTLENRPDLREHIVDILSCDPYPHRTRRIISFQDGYRLSCGDWRIHYQIKDSSVTVGKVCLRD